MEIMRRVFDEVPSWGLSERGPKRQRGDWELLAVADHGDFRLSYAGDDRFRLSMICARDSQDRSRATAHFLKPHSNPTLWTSMMADMDQYMLASSFLDELMGKVSPYRANMMRSIKLWQHSRFDPTDPGALCLVGGRACRHGRST